MTPSNAQVRRAIRPNEPYLSFLRNQPFSPDRAKVLDRIERLRDTYAPNDLDLQKRLEDVAPKANEAILELVARELFVDVFKYQKFESVQAHGKSRPEFLVTIPSIGYVAVEAKMFYDTTRKEVESESVRVLFDGATPQVRTTGWKCDILSWHASADDRSPTPIDQLSRRDLAKALDNAFTKHVDQVGALDMKQHDEWPIEQIVVGDWEFELRLVPFGGPTRTRIWSTRFEGCKVNQESLKIDSKVREACKQHAQHNLPIIVVTANGDKSSALDPLTLTKPLIGGIARDEHGKSSRQNGGLWYNDRTSARDRLLGVIWLDYSMYRDEVHGLMVSTPHRPRFMPTNWPNDWSHLWWDEANSSILCYGGTQGAADSGDRNV